MPRAEQLFTSARSTTTLLQAALAQVHATLALRDSLAGVRALLVALALVVLCVCCSVEVVGQGREMAQQVAGLIDYAGDVCGLTYEAAAALLVREASGKDASVAAHGETGRHRTATRGSPSRPRPCAEPRR
jgi:hypothetical protein